MAQRAVAVADGQPPRAPGLIGLPADLRRRVYVYLGVARLDGSPYTYYLNRRKQSRSSGVSRYDPPPARNFAGLLLSCRALHTDAAALLYSANRFVVYYSCQGSLEPLRALSPTALASLTSLKIVLNESSCHHPTDSSSSPPGCCYDASYDHGPWRRGEFGRASRHCVKYHGYLHHLPLLHPASLAAGLDDSTSADLAVQVMLSEWHDTAAYLSSRVSVQLLTLLLVCDVDPESPYALDVARLVVAPVANLCPRLKDGRIRLCMTPNRPLQKLAEEAVRTACHTGATSAFTSPRPRSATALFTTLPPELRVRILKYTDLITPWKEVTWSRQDRGYQVLRPPCCLDHEPVCPPHVHYGSTLSHCDGPRGGPGCFCRRRHAAFSLAGCQCWAPPTDLFLICRALCADAEFVFFSGNRFVVHDHHAMPPWAVPDDDVQQERFGASVFLRDIVPARCLAHLRFLEMVFPPYAPHDWPTDEHPAIQDWQATVDRLRARINAPALTIRIVMADFHPFEVPEGRGDVTQDQVNDVLGGYARIARPLGPLVRDDALAGFYVQLALPWRWTGDTVLYARQWGEWRLAEEERRLKEDCERGVRGSRDGGRQRAEPRRSVWQRWYEIVD